MPAWWRYADPFFRKLHASDLAQRVLPTHPWDDDPTFARAPPVDHTRNRSRMDFPSRNFRNPPRRPR